ncbi:DUF7344 domain-containing protein [Natronobiforma cellulositropha]|uniref:DUF7344 domain-containing protein n=1 Tax=Natronobiforma cellulositropha TaxID=1679076 RepID=UPI0021D59792|nr:hypothetical protein [Natronobiforma cellulositropha]
MSRPVFGPLDTASGGGVTARCDIFAVLSNQRRLYVLEYLVEHTRGSADFRDVVDYVAARENETSVEELRYANRKPVYTALRQLHLPKMAEHGVVRYDRSRGDVELGAVADEASLYLEYVPDDDLPWCHCYLGLAGVSAGLVLAVGVGAPVFASLSPLALAGIITAMFTVSALVHVVDTRRHALNRRSRRPTHSPLE